MVGSGLIKKLTDENFEKEISKGKTLVDFYADWCGPCRMLTPELEEVAKQSKGKATVAKLDVDNEQKTASKFQVTSVPTMIIFKDGKEVDRIVGLRDAEGILDALNEV